MKPFRRAGVLPVGETSRSDSGGGVSAEECSSRMAETFLFYLTLSIAETSAMLRMTNGHPYGERDLLRMLWGYNGKVTGGASPSPTISVAVNYKKAVQPEPYRLCY